uniref:Uncharacterized protein n=1 Tax=Arundo donax TaxID=35708 RepID=A0A0A9AJI4_ARUDO
MFSIDNFPPSYCLTGEGMRAFWRECMEPTKT